MCMPALSVLMRWNLLSQDKFLVCVNMFGNKALSDSDSESFLFFHNCCIMSFFSKVFIFISSLNFFFLY